MQNFVVGAALFDAVEQTTVIHAQKFHAARIETAAEVRLVIRRKLSLFVLPNLVDHAAEINNAANSRGGTAET